MDRREFIAASSAFGAVGVAGCAGSSDDSDDGAADTGSDDSDDSNGTDEPPTASLVVTDQRTFGETFSIDGLETEAATSLVVLNEHGEEIAGTGVTFDAGETQQGYTVEFYEPIDATTGVTVQLTHDEEDVLAESTFELTVVEEAAGELVPGETTLTEADPDLGFEYPFFVYVPTAVADEDGGSILVEPNNTGTSTDTFLEHQSAAETLVERGVGRTISDELAVPLLVPVFPRPRSDPVDWEHYVHALDAETMAIEDGALHRIDLQLLDMVDHARNQLEAIGYEADERILMNGFSASGNFVNRFPALHPDRVRSVTAGGINGTALLPTSEAAGHRLPYPIGVDDVEALTGDPFDDEAWADVAQFVYMGGADENDTIPFDDAWNDDLREIALDVYGEDMQEERMPYCEAVYDDHGAAAQFNLYEGVDHRTPVEIVDDCVAFHRENMPLEAGIERIEPTTPRAAQIAFSIVDTPVGGDTELVFDVFVDPDFVVRDESLSIIVFDGPQRDFNARIEDSSDSDRFIDPGTDGTVSVDLDTSTDAVPLEAGATVTASLYDSNPLETETVSVE